MDNPTSTRELMRPVVLTPTPNRPADTPALFRFYGWNTDNPSDPKPTTLLPFATAGANGNELSDADVKKVARIEITFRVEAPQERRRVDRLLQRGDPAHRRPQCPYGRAQRPMSVIAPPSDPRGERGISMFLVVVAMFLTSMFVVAGFAAAGSDFKTSAGSKSRKGAYAAAEAGLAYYVKQLRTNPDFWTQCDAADAPNSAEASPINQQYDGGVDNRKWRKLPSISAEYTIELLHTPKFDKCDRTKQESLVDVSNGTFKVRVTGREYKGTTKGAKRSLIATFKRSGFLKFVYFTDQENRDPQADANASNRATQQTNCVKRKRTARKRARGCVEIQFTDNGRHQRPAAHQRREPAGLRVAALRARDAQGRQPGHDRLDRGLRRRLQATSRTAAVS